MPGKVKDISGKVFKKLTVLEFAGQHQFPNGSKTSKWKCLCQCGKEKILTLAQLSMGQISCGCELENFRKNILPKITAERNSKPNGVAAFNELYCAYRIRAKNKNISFDLTKEEFRTITKQNCFYCGVEPKQVGHKKQNGNYLYNGIDRINNDIGYNKENSRPCCGVCNKAKRDLKIGVFLDWINRLVKFQNNKNES